MTKLMDMIGNEVTAGSTLFWKHLGAIVRMKEISEDRPPNADPKKKYGHMVIEVAIPFEAMRSELYLEQFVMVVDPEQTKAAAELVQQAVL